jgi:CubicO group peptidase (beta-lactamase class C family)
MNNKWTTALIVGSLITGMHSAVAATLPESRKQAIDGFVSQFVDFAMFDGTILIDIAGQTVYEQSFGFAQVEQNVRHDANTRFRLASVSKTLTDAAIAKMIENGVFALDTPIARFLPEFPSADIITIAHLIEHTSGIPHTNTLPWGDGTLSLTIDEIVDRLANLPLTFEPGTDARYSNGGFTVLAKILEIAGNGTFSEVMRATVFEPLGMHDTDHITDSRTPIPNMATGYEPGLFPGQRRHTRFYAVEIRPGGGSFYSTKGDMLRFVQGVFRDDFVPADLRHTILGQEDEVFVAQGRSPGFVAKLLYDPKQDMIVVSLSNSYAVPSDWVIAIADLATGKVEKNPWPELVAAAPKVEIDDIRIGRYQSSFTQTETRLERDSSGTLMIVGSNSAQNAAIPLDDGAFLQPLYFQRCEQDADTRVVVCKMLSGEERYTSTYTPIEN